MSLFKKKFGESSETQASDNPWLKSMEGVDSFSEHMKKLENSEETKDYSPSNSQETSKTQRALERIGVAESRGDDAKFDEDLNNLDPKDALRMLVFINGIITGKGKKERRTWSFSSVWGGAEVSGHLSPARETQDIAIEETFDAIKNDITDNHKRAALAYYMINHLHLFGDGNGRTARTMYEVFDKRDFRIVGSDFMHQTDDEEEVGDRKNFTERTGLRDNAEVSSITLGFIKDDLVKESRLPEKMLENDYSLNLPSSNRPMPDVYLTEDAERNLQIHEKGIVRHAFFEKALATTALGIMLQKKHTFRWAAEDGAVLDPYSNSVLFEIEKKDRRKAKEVFNGWDADDYRDFCGTVKELQLRQIRKLIDIFKHEDQYKTEDGKTYADVLSGQ